MPWALVVALAASAVVGAGLGWPLGFIAAAGCLLLPFAVVQALLYLFPPRVLRPPPPPHEPLRVTAIRLNDPGTSIGHPPRPAITERNP
jgi:hypothetical protein